MGPPLSTSPSHRPLSKGLQVDATATRKGALGNQMGKREVHRAGKWVIDVVATRQQQPTPTAMQLKTILNHVEKQKGFVYQDAQWNEQRTEILVTLQPHQRSRPICSGCGKKRPGYDNRPVRRFEFVPLWNIPVILLYAMRRVASTAPNAASKSSESLGQTVSTNPLTATVFSWLLGPSDSVGRRPPPSLERAGTRFIGPSTGSSVGAWFTAKSGRSRRSANERTSWFE